MKIKTYFTKNYKIEVIGTIIMYGFFGFLGFQSTNYLWGSIWLLMLIIMARFLLNIKIVLYDDKIVIYQIFKKMIIDLYMVESLEIGDGSMKFSSMKIPTIYFILKNNKQVQFFYKRYPRESIIEIINYFIDKNNKINLDSNVSSFIKNEESIYDNKKKKDAKNETKETIIIGVVVVIIVIFKYILN